MDIDRYVRFSTVEPDISSKSIRVYLFNGISAMHKTLLGKVFFLWMWFGGCDFNSNFWYFEIRSVFITQNNIWYSSNEVSVQMTFMTCYLFRESVNQTDHMEVVYEHLLLRNVDCISWSSQTFLNISEHVARYSFSKWKHSESKEIGFYLDCAMLV